MLFQSKFANLQVFVRDPIPKRHPMTGDIIEGGKPALYVSFGKMGPQYTYTDPLTGLDAQAADINGHFLDTDLEAEEKNWPQEEKELVERTLQAKAKQFPDMLWEIVREKAPAARPWPSYDDTEPEAVIALARQLGLVEETIAYEQENLQRPLILHNLQGLEVEPEPEPEPDEPEPVEEPAPAAKGRVKDPKLLTL